MPPSSSSSSGTLVARSGVKPSKSLSDAFSKLKSRNKYVGSSAAQTIKEEDLNQLESTITSNQFMPMNLFNSGFVEELTIPDYPSSSPFIELCKLVPIDADGMEYGKLIRLQQYIVYNLLKSFSYDTEAKEYNVTVTAELLTLSTIMAVGHLPEIELNFEDTVEEVPAYDPKMSLAENYSKKLYDVHNNKDIVKELQIAATKFMVYMIILMLRKSGTYKLATKANENVTAEEFAARVKNLTSSTNTKKFALVNITSMDRETLLKQYCREFQIVDCALLYILVTKLQNHSMKEIRGDYVQALNEIIPVNTQLNATNGSILFAYKVAITFLHTVDQLLPDFSFTKEVGYPDVLNQYDQIKFVATELLGLYSSATGVRVYLNEVITDLTRLFESPYELLQLYHPGHPQFVTVGRSATETMGDVISWLATLGSALALAKSKDQSNLDNDKTLAWLNIPLFRNAPKRSYELRLLAVGMATMATKVNESLLEVVKNSMAITSGLNNLVYSKITLNHLKPNIIGSDSDITKVPAIINSGYNKSDVSAEDNSEGDAERQLEQAMNEKYN